MLETSEGPAAKRTPGGEGELDMVLEVRGSTMMGWRLLRCVAPMLYET